jgi:hypothetical protein
MSVDPKDPLFAEVTCIVCEPPSTSGAIVDQLQYFIEEEGMHPSVPSKLFQRVSICQLHGKRMQLASASTADDCVARIKMYTPRVPRQCTD